MDNSGGVSAEHDVEPKQSIVQKLRNILLSRFLISLGAQFAMSGFHMALGFLLIRVISRYDFGVYSFAFVLAMFAGALNNALISTPLTVYTPVIKDDQERADQEAMFSTLNVLLFLSLCLCGIGYAFFTGISTPTGLAVTAFVATYAARQFSRSFGYARFKPLVTATGDIAYVCSGVTIVGMVVYLNWGKDISVVYILMGLATANLLAMFIERLRLHGAGRSWFTFAKLNSYGQVWEQSRWALAGAVTTLFVGQAHALIVTSKSGPSAFAPLAAGMVLFGPVRVALLTWQNMVKPELALALSNNQGELVKKQIRKTVLLVGVAVLIFALCLWLAWPHINYWLYSKEYADQPMGYIVCMWTVITFFAAIYNAPSAALQAMKDFRVLAMASVYGAIISGVLVSLLLYFYNPASTLLGIIAAECFMAVYLIRIMLNHLKEEWQ